MFGSISRKTVTTTQITIAHGGGYGTTTFPADGLRILFYESMAQHPSLRGASALGAKRNVLKRFERVELLKKRGQWKDGERVTGLRKTKPDA